VTQFETAVPRSRSLRRDALVLAVGMGVANAGNYLFNVVMAFLLGPEAYGALAALLAVVLVGSVPGLALQAVVARRTALAGSGGSGTAAAESGTAGRGGRGGGEAAAGSERPGSGEVEGGAAWPHGPERSSVDGTAAGPRDPGAGVEAGAAWPGVGWLVGRAGVGLALLTVLAGPGLVLFLHLDSAVPVVWLALALAPTPLLFAVQGLLQGRERFGALAAVMLAGAGVKLAAGLALVVAGLGVNGAMAGVAAGALLASLAGLRLAAPVPTEGVDNRTRPGPPWATLPLRGASNREAGFWRAARARQAAATRGEAGWFREVGTATAGLFGLFLLANVDVLLARHYLDRAAAGRYALGAVVAKIAFWAPQFVVTVVFPRLVGAADPRRLLAGSALLIAGFGGLLAGVLALADRVGLIVPLLGGGYAGLGPLLPLFAAFGTALALVQLLLFEGIATRDRRVGRAVAVALVVEIALVAGPLHGSVAEVAGTALAVAVGLVLAGWWLLRRRLSQLRAPVTP
jgi:O-antigen/teichoic acid export membrane protein